MVVSLVLRGNSDLSADTVAVQMAVYGAWGLIKKLPVFGQLDQLLRSVRIAAVVSCPDPESHGAVLRYCLYPLGGDVISEVTERAINDHLPSRMEGQDR